METKTKANERAKGAKSSKKKKKSSSGRALKTLLIILAALVVVLGTLYYFLIYRENQRTEIINGTTFHEGITVGGVSVGGLTVDEAKAAIAATAEAEIANGVSFEFVCDGKSYVADSSNFTITYNTDEVLTEALGLAREGEYSELMEQIRDIKENGREFAIDYTVEPTGIETFIHSFADEVTIEPTPATFTVKQLPINEDTGVFDAVDIGLPSAEDEDKEKSDDAEADTAAVTDLRDLRFDFVEAVDGFGVDIDALMEDVTARCESKNFGSIDVVMENIPSDITIETLKETLVLRASSTTSYKSTRRNSNRVFNLKKATGLVYGTVLMPEQEFSANTILGDRTAALGWKMAPAVIGGGTDTEDQPGGGVCQISTTTYQAVLKGDLEVIYRRGHSSKSGYADGGLDCTINTGTIDFQWKNNTPNPLYIFTWVNTKDYTVHCEIYGDPLPPEYDEIVLSSELVETIVPGAPEYEVNSSLYSPYWYVKNNAKDGYVYKAYATYMLGGKEVKKVEVNTTTYKMHPQRFYVWPGYDGSPLLPQNQLTATDDGSLVLATQPVDDSQIQ